MSDSARWQRAKEVFGDVVGHDGEEQAALLRARCGADAALQADVESLLAADRDRGSLLEQPISPTLRGLALAAFGDGRADTPAFAPGVQLGTYTIGGLIGTGGMGEVYRAHDSALGREVAIKIVPAQWNADADRRARLEREARLLAALNHPNIGSIYGLAESDGIRGLVLELVDGATLAERIARQPAPATGLRCRDALTIALQIAEALEAAHERGIVHRDLKPGNIKVTADGRVKVLDFGVAIFTGGSAPGAASNSPDYAPDTVTREEVLFGTAPYMSPEQARGEPVDKRTDIWAFGCILYELVTGERPFDGAHAAETLSRILHQDPDFSRLPPGLPPIIVRLMTLCLEKDRAKRLPQIAIARFQIAEALANPPDKSTHIADHEPRLRVLQALGLGALLGAVGVLGVVFLRLSSNSVTTASLTRLLVSVAPAEEIGGIEGRPTRTSFAISPDGRILVFSAARGIRRSLYVRRLDRLDATPIEGTDGAESPFFSPDARWVGYWAAGRIRKAPVSGGPSVPVTDAALVLGASWGDDDRIVFSGGTGLLQVSAGGGPVTALTLLDDAQDELSHRLPHVLPGSDAILFTITKNRFPRWDETQIAVHSRRTGRSRVLMDGGADARYASTGHVVYVREGMLLAAPFDREKLALGGGPVGLIPDVMQAAYFRGQQADAGAAQFAISDTGTLVYVQGGTVPPDERIVVRADRSGRTAILPLAPRPFATLRLSPDGEAIALSTFGRERSVWVYAPRRNTFSRLPAPGRNGVPIWTPDGERLTYATATSGPDRLHSMRADGAGAPQPVISADQDLVPATWTADARRLLYYPVPPIAIRVHDVVANIRPTTLLVATDDALVGGADLSPDGRWIAYHAEESAAPQVYVQAYPAGIPRYQISADGGMSPIWRRDGRELFYLRPNSPFTGSSVDLSIMSVAVGMTPAFTFGAPKELFTGRYAVNRPARAYDVSPNGQQFLLLQSRQRAPERITHMHVLLNWFEELRRLVPRK